MTDFGLAKRLDGDSGQTRSGTVMGTPSYMAPEQAQGHSKAVGPAADVWALGAILYELLTGRPPFRAASPMDTLFQVIQDDPVPPARLQPTCPRDLEIICLKCLQKERHKRYASAEELAEDLRRFQNGETIRARPAGKWERSIKWARRHPAIAALVAVSSLAVLALAGAAVGHDFYLRMKVAEAVAATERADQKREQAEQEKKQAIKEKTLAARRAECRPQLEQARAALAKDKLEHNDLNMAETSASEVRDRTRDELALADLTAEAERLLDRVKRLRGLFRGRDEALFQLNRQLLTGLDRPESLEVADQEARAALALCGVDSEANVGPALDKEVSDSERKEITRGCFHVLLIQADALVWPWVFPPGGKQVGPVKQEVVQQALRILDRANKLVPSTEVYHLRRARYLDLLGQTAEARTARVLARQHQATAPFDLFLVGSERMLEKQGSQAALGDFERALRDDPDLFWARFFLAVGLKLRDPAQARGHLTVCISQRPDFVWCYLIRGFINGEKPLSDFKGAEADFVTAAQLNERRRKEGKPDQSAEYVLLVNRGVLRVRQGRYKEAVEDLEKAAALRPKQFQGHLNLGVAYREQQRRLEAARLFAIPPQPARLAAVLGVAVAGQDWGQWKEVLAQLDEAVKLRPDLALLYRERAQLHLLREDPGAALKDFRRAIDAPEQGERKTHEDYLECGLIHYLEKRYKEAAAACDAALRLRGDYAPAHRLRGEALFERAEHEVLVAEKQRLYREALRSFDNYLLFRGPPKAEVYQFRALAHWGLGNYAAVVGEYNHALTVRPGDPTLLAAQGWAYIALEDWKRARDDFTQAIGRDPTNAQAHNGFGYALVKLGKPIEGVREAREALELGPPTERLFYNAARVFAQASAVEAALAQSSRGSWDKSEDYREEAVRRLVQALALVKEQQRAEFWRKTVRPDSGDLKGALYPLRRSPRFADLAEQYDRPAGGRPQ
ncbi:MAG: tetratricopeptide repeat protein [Planctomycetes bacterium]|nr:tetratricopeptide repeat protein [Planctomycetota bacterium]